jgi:hypothetical protein
VGFVDGIKECSFMYLRLSNGDSWDIFEDEQLPTVTGDSYVVSSSLQGPTLPADWNGSFLQGYFRTKGVWQNDLDPDPGTLPFDLVCTSERVGTSTFVTSWIGGAGWGGAGEGQMFSALNADTEVGDYLSSATGSVTYQVTGACEPFATGSQAANSTLSPGVDNGVVVVSGDGGATGYVYGGVTERVVNSSNYAITSTGSDVVVLVFTLTSIDADLTANLFTQPLSGGVPGELTTEQMETKKTTDVTEDITLLRTKNISCPMTLYSQYPDIRQVFILAFSAGRDVGGAVPGSEFGVPYIKRNEFTVTGTFPSATINLGTFVRMPNLEAHLLSLWEESDFVTISGIRFTGTAP